MFEQLNTVIEKRVKKYFNVEERFVKKVLDFLFKMIIIVE